jgi:hypothetical protein
VCRIDKTRACYTVLVLKAVARDVGNRYGREEVIRQAKSMTRINFGYDQTYWIAAIGSEWCCGKIVEDEPDQGKLVDWRKAIHDDESLQHFQNLIDWIDSAEVPHFGNLTEKDKPTREQMDEYLNGPSRKRKAEADTSIGNDKEESESDVKRSKGSDETDGDADGN